MEDKAKCTQKDDLKNIYDEIYDADHIVIGSPVYMWQMNGRTKDFVDRFEKNESIWPVIEKAKSKFGIGLLTNMYTNMLGLVKKRGLLPNIDWDVVIDSSVEKVIKPTEAIFKLAQERSGVNVNEIMFVENGKKHVEAAKAFGWQTFLYDSTNLEDSSKNLLNSLSSLQF